MAEQLKRSLTRLDVIALGVNGVIGTGIFLLPGKWFAALGPAAILALLFAALLSFVIALCFAEVSSYFRGTGGAYLYALRTFGDLPGFLVGWMTCVVTVVAWAALANGLVQALAAFAPVMDSGWPRTVFLLGFMGLLTVVNLCGAKLGAVVANIFTAAKLVPIAVFIAAGLFFIDGPRFQPFAPHGYGDFFTATLLIFYAFVGFEGLVVPAGEMAKPRRDVPIALISVLVLVVIVYLSILCVAIGTFPSLAGSDRPVAAASETFLGGWGGTLIGVGVVISMVGINAASALVGPRRIYAMAEQGHLPGALKKTNTAGSPGVAIITLYVVAGALAVWGGYVQLALISVIARFAQYISTSIAVLFLRRRGPLPAPGGDGEDLPSPAMGGDRGVGWKEEKRRETFRLPLGPVIPILSLTLCCFMVYQSDADKQLAGTIAVEAGMLVYIGLRARQGFRGRQLLVVFGLALAGGAAIAAQLALRRPTPIAEPADTIVTGARVVTMASTGPKDASTIALRGDRIAYVGDARALLSLRGPKTRVVALPGSMVLPGFHDAHVHPVTGGIEYRQCNLNGASSRELVMKAVSAYARTNTKLEWLVGGGWDLTLFPDSGPTAASLDDRVPDRPAYLTAADAHSAWVNTRALRIAGIDRATPDPPGGRIERDANGNPSGTLREAAMSLVANKIPPLTTADHVAGLRLGMSRANRYGITSVQEASADVGVLDAYRELADAGQLTLRVVAAQRVDLTRGVEQIPELVKRIETYQGDRLRATSAKLFADGVIEAKTAALLEPYIGTESRGELNLQAARLRDMVVALDGAGLDVHIHAIGDRAIRASLDAFAAARAKHGQRGRHTIAHLQLIDPEDIPRFRQLGVVANFQALWAQADPYIVKLTEPFLGAERSRWLYPIASVVKTGAVVVGGSDWSVSSMNPLRAIQVGLTRAPIGEPDAPPWIAEERIDLDTALAMYTRAGAYLLRQESQTGTLEVGKKADLVILDRDLYQIPARDIHKATVQATLLDGRAVYCVPALCPRLATSDAKSPSAARASGDR